MVQDVGWAQKQFARINFGEHFLKVKLDLHRTARSFNKHYGAPLNEVDEASVEHFINPESIGDLLVGLDLAYQAVADSRVRYVMIMREAVDANQAVAPYTSSISFSDANLPHLEFFDNYYENRGGTCRVSVYGQRKAELENYQLELELDWDAGYRAETHGGRPSTVVLPEQIKKIGIVHWHGPKETVVDQTDFDPSKLAIIATHGTIEAGATLSYYYEGEVVYVHTIEDSDDPLVIVKIIKNKEAITNRVFA
jgi:hypothetical protein